MIAQPEPPIDGEENGLPPSSAGHQPVERLWDDDAFRARVREVAQLRGMSVRDVIRNAGTSPKYMERSNGRQTNIVMRIAKILDCHPAYLLFGPTVATSPDTPADLLLGREEANSTISPARAEQRLAMMAQIIAAYWLNMALDPRGAARIADNHIRQIKLLLL